MLRRAMLKASGGLLTALALPTNVLASSNPVIIEMKGTARGARVWYTPVGLQVNPGTVIRFVNRDAGNVHTATAIHPDQQQLPQRIPNKAAPFNSGYLQPDAFWDMTLDVPGVYDYFCIPHLRAGMVGRILVGEPKDWEISADDYLNDGIPERALDALPSIGDILADGAINLE